MYFSTLTDNRVKPVASLSGPAECVPIVPAVCAQPQPIIGLRRAAASSRRRSPFRPEASMSAGVAPGSVAPCSRTMPQGPDGVLTRARPAPPAPSAGLLGRRPVLLGRRPVLLAVGLLLAGVPAARAAAVLGSVSERSQSSVSGSRAPLVFAPLETRGTRTIAQRKRLPTVSVTCTK